MNNKKITHEEYLGFFKRSKNVLEEDFDKENKEILKEAFKHACEIRKFEIDLYWKRAAYFWTFIGATFVGYAAIFNSAVPISNGSGKELILILISCLGLVFSVAWHCVNKGSKFWQENWENHVELLEDEVIGPLYKIFTSRPTEKRMKFEIFLDFFSAPKPYSVSKVNQFISTYMVVIWLLILCSSAGEISTDYLIDWKKLILISTAVSTCAFIVLGGKSHQGRHIPDAYLRSAHINN